MYYSSAAWGRRAPKYGESGRVGEREEKTWRVKRERGGVGGRAGKRGEERRGASTHFPRRPARARVHTRTQNAAASTRRWCTSPVLSGLPTPPSLHRSISPCSPLSLSSLSLSSLFLHHLSPTPSPSIYPSIPPMSLSLPLVSLSLSLSSLSLYIYIVCMYVCMYLCMYMILLFLFLSNRAST